MAGILPIAYLFLSKKRIFISLTLYLSFSFLATLGIVISTKMGANNHWIIKLYNFTSFLCLMHYFYKILSSKINYSLIFSILYIAVFILDYVFSTSNIFLVSILFIITCCILFFINETKKENRSVEFRTVSIINASLLFYFSFSFIFLSLLWKLINYQIWEIHNIIESTSKLIITYAFWKLPKTSQ